jgi:hypothetical protein
MARRRSPVTESFKFKVELTKIDVAAESLKAAVWLYFEDLYPAAVYLLAASAREITTTLADKAHVSSLLTQVAENLRIDRKALTTAAHRFANFMKHANRDPQGTIELPHRDIETVLFVACNDFCKVTGGMPVEAHVFQIWCALTNFQHISDAPLRTQNELRRYIHKFPGIRRANNAKDRKLIGLRALQAADTDPAWGREYKRTVELTDQ